MLPDLSLLPLPLATFDGQMSAAAVDRQMDGVRLAAARSRFVSTVGGIADEHADAGGVDAAPRALLTLALAYASAGRYADGIAQCALAAALVDDALGRAVGTAVDDDRPEGESGNGNGNGNGNDRIGTGTGTSTSTVKSADAGWQVLASRAACLRACLLAHAEQFEEAIDVFAVVLDGPMPHEAIEPATVDMGFVGEPNAATRDAEPAAVPARTLTASTVSSAPTQADAVADKGARIEAMRWRIEAGIGAALCQATVGRGTEAKATLDRVLPHLQTWIAAVQGGADEGDARRLMVRFGYAQVRSLLSLHQPMESLAALAHIETMGGGDGGQTALLQAAAFLSLGRPMQAVAPLEAVFALHPDDPSALVLYGQAMAALGEYAYAVDRFEAALRVRPRFAPAYRYMASALAMQKNDDAALVCLRAARDIRPDFPEAWLDEAGIRLRCGQLRRGFAAYEWRDGARLAARRSDRYWNGDDSLVGRSLLVVAEQGLGDAIHFLRYVPLVRALARDVVVEVQAPLWRLVAARAAAWGVRVIPRGTPLPDCDRFTLLMSLPHALQTTLSTIPGGDPYLFTEPALALPRLTTPTPVAGEDATANSPQPSADKPTDKPTDPLPHSMAFPYRDDGTERDDAVPLRVGLVVSGNPEYRNDAFRSMPLSMCAPLFALAGVDYVMLQPTLRDADRQWIAAQQALGAAGNWHAGLLDMPQGDFADTAAVIDSLDLVISVDTAIAHLCGALGKPVWVMLPYVADWRWLSDRSDSPWYPSARLFRQRALQDWPSVVADLVAALRQRIDA